MKKNSLLLFLLFLLPFLVDAQSQTIKYEQGTGVIGGQTASISFNYLSTCQTAVTVVGDCGVYNGFSWSAGTWNLIVNGITVGSYGSTQTVDISAYIPITSVQLTSNAGTWHTVSATINVTSSTASAPAAPGISNVNYCLNQTPSPLTASLSGMGTTLKWYTTVNGGGYTTTAPTPSTAAAGTTSYWVSQANASGCESVRSEIVVTVSNFPTAPTVTTPVVYAQGETASPLTATGTSLLWYTTSTGGVGNASAPTPSTSTVGSTSYWVSQSTGSCEGPRAEIVVNVQAGQTIPYNAGTGVNGGQTASVTMNYLSTCQESVSVTGDAGIWNGVVWSTGTWNLIVNGITIGSYSGAQTIDISSYIPVTSVQLTSNAGTWHTVGGTVNVTSFSASAPVAPAIANVTYCQNETASPLTATISGSGTTLKWYTTANGAGYTLTAPTPSTASVGTTSYWVAQADASGCESLRSEIVVTVNAVPTAPTVTTPVVYGQGSTATALTATGSGLLWYTAATGGIADATAPIPSTTTVGTTSYWVSQTTNGCESPRAEIVVNIQGVQTIPFNAGTGVIGGQTASITFDYLSTCQESVTVDGDAGIWNGVVWSTGTWNLIVNGITVGSYSSAQTIDISSYIPVTSVQLTSNAGTWHTVGGTVNVTSFSTSAPVAPAIANVVYCQNETANPLSATISGSGTTLKWYTTAQGAGYTLTAPTPSTTTVGTTSYWVAQADASGCESLRSEILVTVNAPSTGTFVHTACGSYTWIDGINYVASNNTATHTLTNAVGCDSVVTLNLTINMPNTGTDVITACGSHTWIDGVTYVASNNSATHTLTNAAGCDSVVTLNLTINMPNSGTDVITACDSHTWIDGVTYVASNNTATHTLTNAAGCDSVVTLNLTINTVDVSVTQIDAVTIEADAVGATYQWIDCANNQVISGATSQTFTATVNGNYAVIVTENNCSDTSACTTINSVGIEENGANISFTLYPNPTNGNVTISLGKGLTNGEIRVFDVYGKIVSRHVVQTSNSIELELLGNPGIYYIELDSNLGKYKSKVIKQ